MDPPAPTRRRSIQKFVYPIRRRVLAFQPAGRSFRGGRPPDTPGATRTCLRGVGRDGAQPDHDPNVRTAGSRSSPPGLAGQRDAQAVAGSPGPPARRSGVTCSSCGRRALPAHPARHAPLFIAASNRLLRKRSQHPNLTAGRQLLTLRSEIRSCAGVHPVATLRHDARSRTGVPLARARCGAHLRATYEVAAVAVADGPASPVNPFLPPRGRRGYDATIKRIDLPCGRGPQHLGIGNRARASRASIQPRLRRTSVADFPTQHEASDRRRRRARSAFT